MNTDVPNLTVLNDAVNSNESVDSVWSADHTHTVLT